MKPSSIAGIILLVAVAPAFGADTELPDGTGRVWLAQLPPDLASFPPGTGEIRIEADVNGPGGGRQLRWEFDREDRGGLLLPRQADTDPLPALPGEPASPAIGPLQALKGWLAALDAADPLKAAVLTGGSGRARFENDPDGAVAALKEQFDTAGIPAGRVAEAFLPNLLKPKPGLTRLSVKYRAPADVGEEQGMVHIDFVVEIERADEPRWVVVAFTLDFRRRRGRRPAPAERVLEKGVHLLCDSFAPPEMSGFPAGTTEIELGGMLWRENAWMQVRAEFKPDDRGRWSLDRYRLRERPEPPRNAVAARIPPTEGPLDSVRNLLGAFLSLELDKIRRYISVAGRKEFDRAVKEQGVDRIKAMMARQSSHRGFVEPEILRANLPRKILAARGCAVIETAYRFPGEAKGKKGLFTVGFFLMTDAEDADRWVPEDLDVDFDER